MRLVITTVVQWVSTSHIEGSYLENGQLLVKVKDERQMLTKWMAAAQLRLLRVLGLEFVTNAVEELDVALLWILLKSRHKSPRHGSSSLASDVCVLPISHSGQQMFESIVEVAMSSACPRIVR